MSETNSFGFGKFVPGFDFLQNLAQTAAKGQAPGMPQMPSLGSWIAPTMSVEELEKRIEELKAVQFWLDQNSRALTATVQALEVQKMTLATLKGMNVSLNEVANAFKIKTPKAEPAAPPASSEPKAAAAQESPKTSPKEEPRPAAGVVDPMQWWGSLTQQFQQIAATAMQDAARQAVDSTRQVAAAAKKATGTSAKAAAKKAPARKAATKAAAKTPPTRKTPSRRSAG